MKFALIVITVLVAVAVLVAAVGWSLPVKHRAARQAFLTATPDAVYAVISAPKDFPTWRSKVKSVEILADSERHASYRETGDDGSISYVVDEAVPAHRLITRIADRSLPFGGTWTYELAPAGNGTTLRITEDGEVYNIIFRVMARYVFGHEATIDTYLRDLGRHFGESVTITGVS
jgi:hypothetical protein